ncbi:hypothetical protein D3C87_1800220 [compost metagenome]
MPCIIVSENARRSVSVQAFMRDSFMVLFASRPLHVWRMLSPVQRFMSPIIDSAMIPCVVMKSRASFDAALLPMLPMASQYGSLL